MHDSIRTVIAILLLGTVLVRVEPAAAQIYENRTWPSSLDWMELNAGPVRILYPSGFEREAQRAARISTDSYPRLQHHVGGSLNRFPLILNAVNDQNNGFVSPVHFRSEIYLSPRRGLAFHPRSSSWLDQVIPHELVHALHYNHHAPGVIRWLRPFSPDLVRSLHATAPSGMFEGIAVWAETETLPDVTGRGVHSLFLSPFLDALRADRPWGMGQLVHPSRYHYPLNRHYSGSWYWTDWLLTEYGDEIYKKTIRAHSQWPFFGFGFSLRRSTGQWPNQLYKQFIDDTEALNIEPTPVKPSFGHRLAGVPNSDQTLYRSPKWMSNREILFYREGVSMDPGLGVWNLDTQTWSTRLITGVGEAMDLSRSPDGSSWIYSDYRSRPRFDTTRFLDLFRMNPDTGEQKRLTRFARLYNPLDQGSSILALQIVGERNRLVRIHPDSGVVEPVVEPPPDGQFEQIVLHPSIDGLFAVTARRGKEVGLWIIREGRWEENLQEPPTLYFSEKVIRDPVWHPYQEELLFSSDRNGTYDLYHYRVEPATLTQWTDDNTHQLEPDWSPSGRDIVWVEPVGGVYKPRMASVPTHQSSSLQRTHSPAQWRLFDKNSGDRMNRESNPEEASSRPYQPGISWVKPRMVLPLWRQYEDETWMAGIQIASTELLSRETYHMQSGWMADQIWGEMVYRNSHQWPSVELELYRRPRFHSVPSLGTIDQTDRYYQLLTRRDGASLSIPMRWTWWNRPDHSTLQVVPRVQIQDEQVFRERDRTLFGENGIETLTSSLLISYQHRIRQQLREMQPGSGWIFFLQGEAILSSRRTGAEQILFPGYGERSLSAGVYRYLRLFNDTNGTGRLGVRMVQQTIQGRYSIGRLLTGSYQSNGLDRVREALVLEHRWTVPIWWMDRGGLLLPAHAHGLFGVLFGETILPTGRSTIEGANSRTQLGAGLRFRGQWGRFAVDLGVGWVYDWNRQKGFLYGGDF
ncbi:MAG: hypothetical protein WD115_02130 [Balneolaceae bacterium]